MIYLKRDIIYTPIIFQHPDLVNKKYCKLDDLVTMRKKYDTSETFRLNLNIDRLDAYRVVYPRSQYSYSEIPGGLVKSDGSLIAVVVVKDGEKYVIVDEGFSVTFPSAFARLKKSVNDLGISSRTKLLLWNKSRIASTFQEMISPTMTDYMPDKQVELSNRFILSERSKYLLPVAIEVAKEDIGEFNFEIDDWVTILKSSSNWTSSGEMDKFIGRTVQITSISSSSSRIRFNEDGNWSWTYENRHFRHATQDEINRELGIHPIDAISQPITLDEAFPVESTREYNVGDYIVILNQNDSITIPIGTVLPIVENASSTSVKVDHDNFRWWVSHTNIRHATSEEIEMQNSVSEHIDEILEEVEPEESIEG